MPELPDNLPWYRLVDADEFRPMTMEEASEWLRIPVSTIEHWAARGRIPKIKLAHRVMFNLHILRTFVQSNTRGLDNAAHAPVQCQQGAEGGEPETVAEDVRKYASRRKLKLSDC